MAITWLRSLACFLSALLLSPLSTAAFDTPLSDTAVRGAYFLGQRHDEKLALFLDRYTLRFSEPKTGPYISSVTLFTPYALAAQWAGQQGGPYSAQQAQLDHQKLPELVRVVIQITFTESYGPYLVRPTASRRDSTKGIALRPSDFWKDFRVHVYDRDSFLIPSNAHGEPTYFCTDDSCQLSGATLIFDYLADSFPSDTITVRVTPPEGDEVFADFDLDSLR
jgi:hypothetical protein